MVVDGRGGAEVWCWESRQDRRPRCMRHVVKCVQGGTFSRRRVSESSCPSARLCLDQLQLKRVTIEGCARCSVSCVHILLERPGCGRRGFGVPKADGSSMLP